MLLYLFMVKFRMIPEAFYYKERAKKAAPEFAAEIMNFRISFFQSNKDILAYYMGRYYIGTMFEPMEEIEVYNAILEQCSDPHREKDPKG